MAATISTGEVQVSERAEYWEALTRERFGVRSRIEAIGDHEFNQTMTTHHLGQTLLNVRVGSAFRAFREPGDEDIAFVVIPLKCDCSIRQFHGPELLLKAGKLAVYVPGAGGTTEFPESNEHLLIAFRRAALTEHCPEWESGANRALDGTAGPGGMLTDLAQTLRQHAGDLGPSCRQSAGTMLLSLLGSALIAPEEGEMSQSTRMRDYHRQRAKNHILAQLCNPELSATRIAEDIGLSRRYLHSLFADQPLHLMQWVQEQRLCRCRADLASIRCDKHSIAQIAYAWGFNDAAHFSRTFQKRFGISPSEFRARVRREQH